MTADDIAIQAKIAASLGQFKPDDAAIIAYRFGTASGTPAMDEDVFARFPDLTRERLRRLEARAMATARKR